MVRDDLRGSSLLLLIPPKSRRGRTLNTTAASGRTIPSESSPAQAGENLVQRVPVRLHLSGQGLSGDAPNSTMQKRPLHPGVGRFCVAEANSFV
jgi:hypothetical protein